MDNFRKLSIWRDSMELVNEIYDLTRNFPSEENFGLKLQIRRSAISIPSNIAEGCGKSTTKDLLRFLDIALGSLNELETQVLIARNQNYISENIAAEIVTKIIEIKKMIHGFKKLKSNKQPDNN